MLFARVASFFFAALTFGLVSANPVPDTEKRTDSVETVVNNLQTTVGSITSQLQGVTTSTLAGLSQLTSAINEASTQAGAATLEKGDTTEDAIADVLASVITTVAVSLTNLVKVPTLGRRTVAEVLPPVVDLVSNLGPLVLSIETALDSLVIGLDGVVPGLSATLKTQLSGDAGIMRDLGWTALPLTLGL